MNVIGKIKLHLYRRDGWEEIGPAAPEAVYLLKISEYICLRYSLLSLTDAFETAFPLDTMNEVALLKPLPRLLMKRLAIGCQAIRSMNIPKNSRETGAWSTARLDVRVSLFELLA